MDYTDRKLHIPQSSLRFDKTFMDDFLQMRDILILIGCDEDIQGGVRNTALVGFFLFFVSFFVFSRTYASNKEGDKAIHERGGSFPSTASHRPDSGSDAQGSPHEERIINLRRWILIAGKRFNTDIVEGRERFQDNPTGGQACRSKVPRTNSALAFEPDAKERNDVRKNLVD